MRLEAKKRVEYIWVPEFLIDDWVHKEHTKLKRFSVFGEQIKSLIREQSMLNFWNQLHLKVVFFGRLLTQTATWQPNYKTLTSSVKVILKAMIGPIFFYITLRVGSIFFLIGIFQTRMRWLIMTRWRPLYLAWQSSPCKVTLLLINHYMVQGKLDLLEEKKPFKICIYVYSTGLFALCRYHWIDMYYCSSLPALFWAREIS